MMALSRLTSGIRSNLWIPAILLAGTVAGCGDPGGSGYCELAPIKDSITQADGGAVRIVNNTGNDLYMASIGNTYYSDDLAACTTINYKPEYLPVAAGYNKVIINRIYLGYVGPVDSTGVYTLDIWIPDLTSTETADYCADLWRREGWNTGSGYTLQSSTCDI